MSQDLNINDYMMEVKCGEEDLTLNNCMDNEITEREEKDYADLKCSTCMKVSEIDEFPCRRCAKVKQVVWYRKLFK